MNVAKLKLFTGFTIIRLNTSPMIYYCTLHNSHDRMCAKTQHDVYSKPKGNVSRVLSEIKEDFSDK